MGEKKKRNLKPVETWSVHNAGEETVQELTKFAKAQRGRFTRNGSEPDVVTSELVEKALRCVPRKADESRDQYIGRTHVPMRCALLDDYRRRNSKKRGGGRPHLGGDAVESLSQERTLSPEEVQSWWTDEFPVIAGRAGLNEREREVVELRVKDGLTQKEIAESLSVSLSSANRAWRVATGKLKEYLERPAEPRPKPEFKTPPEV